MDKHTVIFRADGNSTIGMGHFIRTLALAEMLKDNCNCIYATQNPSDYQVSEINKVCKRLLVLPKNDSHFEVFLSQLQGHEIVVLDNYYFTSEYQRRIKAAGCKLICIDDIQDKHYFADIVINHAEGIKPEMFNLENYTRLLLGYKYALLRKEYLEQDSQNVKKKFSCFLMMGGADPFNLTLKITSILDNFEFSDPIAIVTGDAYLYQSELLKYKNVKLFKGIPSSKVFSLMQQSKFGILAASTIAIEACAARLPFICGYFIDNQKSIYEGILKSNLAICVDNYCEIDGEKIKTAIDKISTPEISTNIIQKQIEKLDKKSKKRFIKIFHEL